MGQVVEAKRPLVRDAGEGEALWFRENHMTIKVSAADSGGAFSLVESWVKANTGPPLHVHHREEETLWVLSGRVRIRCGDDEFTVGPGAMAVLPRDVPHAFHVEGEETAHLLTLMTPGGGEALFARHGRPAGGPGLPPPSAPDIEGMKRIGEQLGQEILGPPMAVSGL